MKSSNNVYISGSVKEIFKRHSRNKIQCTVVRDKMINASKLVNTAFLDVDSR